MDNPLMCDICKKIFTNVANKKQHMKCVQGLKEHKCGECGKEFGRKYRITPRG